VGGAYGVRLVRGPIVHPTPHPRSCETEDELFEQYAGKAVRQHLAVDLFCGAGGLSLGLAEAGFEVILGVDTDPEARQTHRALCPGLSVDWDLSSDEAIEGVVRVIKHLNVTLVAGGPPCQPFSKAGRSKLRHLVAGGTRDAHDHRKELWQSFLHVVLRTRPPAVLMENVPDMVLDRDMLVLRTMVDELERADYSVEERLVDTWRYGVPQFRQRLILVALNERTKFAWPDEVAEQVSVRQAFGDLPEVEGGWRPAGGADGSQDYAGPARSPFQARMRAEVPETDHPRVFDHITRPVRDDDARAFAVMDSSTRYSELPDKLKRYRDDIFDDKYKRLDWDDLSRTITAHIAKDGYWYIHPEQDRTITIREAARLQTFPDHVRFAGPPTAAFRQIGNAVPPRLGEVVGSAIMRSLEQPVPAEWTTTELSERLARWLAERHRTGRVASPWHELAVPNLIAGRAPTTEQRWAAFLSQTLFDRVPLDRARLLWPAARQQLSSPSKTLVSSRELEAIAFGLDRRTRVEQVRTAADGLRNDLRAMFDSEAFEHAAGVSRAVARMVFRLVPGDQHDPIEAPAPVLRLAARFWDIAVHVRNKRSDGRIAVARLVGVDDEAAAEPLKRNQGALAHLALFEIAEHICTPTAPSCGSCPLNDLCASRAELDSGQQVLPT
jgi:DNA (cytosine-5)-methyltransferase 1